MASDILVDILNDCVDRLAQGQTVDDCLRRYPQYASDLAPLLEAGRTAQRAQVSSAEIAQSQERVSFAFERELMRPLPRARRSFPVQQVASFVIAILFILGVLGTGVTVAAQGAIPGDTLYGVKRWSEDVRLSITSDKEPLREQFAQRRIDEARQVIERGREVDLQFTGVITAVDESTITVAGLVVDVPDDLVSIGFQIGRRVEVYARSTIDGRLIAEAILLLDTLELDVPIESTPEATPTLLPTDLPTATGTPTATLSPTLTPSATITNTPARPTQTPTSADCVLNPPADWVRYTIQAGDTPSGIAVDTGISLDELLRVNCNIDRLTFVAGEVIFVPRQPTRRPTATRQVDIPPTPIATQAQVQSPDRRPTATPTPFPRDNQGDESDNSGGRGR